MAKWGRDPYARLAEHLTANHLGIDLSRDDWASIANLKLPPHEEPPRVIVVVGAGASAAAGLLTSELARDGLKKDFENVETELNAELHRLTTIYRLDEGAFETVLLALSELVRPPSRIREWLTRKYATHYCPLLCYEVIAHLMKHRFVEAVISFNFDELLDQSIEDELGPDEYYKILSDGDAPEKYSDSRPYRRPVYLKLHGTVSHPSTLRFTREAYFGLPDPIVQVVRNLLSGAPITVLAIGFAMQSFEFNGLLNEVAIPSEIFFMNKQEVKPDPKLTNIWTTTPMLVAEHCGLDAAITRLWGAVNKVFKKDFKPRSIQRHVLVNRLFGPDGVARPRHGFEKDYFERRAVMEASLTIAKGKGIVNMEVISGDRCGAYYQRLRDKYSPTSPLVELCRKLGLKDFGYMHDIFRYGDAGTRQDHGIVPMNRSIFAALADRAFASMKLKVRRPERDEFINTLKDLYEGLEVEMRTMIDPVYRSVFRNPVQICTGAGFSFHTRQVLADNRWTFLLVSAETGQWLMNETIVELIGKRASNRKMFLLLADRTWEEKLRERYDGRIRLFARHIPWPEHNRHMTITATRDVPLDSIFFARRLRSPTISPVRLHDDDTALVAEAFYVYWRKALGQTIGWLQPREWKWQNLMDLLESESVDPAAARR